MLECDDLPIVFDESDIEVLGVQIYSAVMLGRFGVESHPSLLRFGVSRNHIMWATSAEAQRISNQSSRTQHSCAGV
jgi:hypothetical protein